MMDDYLQAVYASQARGEAASTSGVAELLDVSAASASVMLKRLAGKALVERRGRDVTLTPMGLARALRVVRRHRLLETFLVEILGLPWDEVHAEAAVLQHAVSDPVADRIDAVLGHPTHDPHGHPIPAKDGRHDEQRGASLDSVPPGTSFVVEQVSDRDSAALRHLAAVGIKPGVSLDVEEQAPFGGPRWISVEGRRHALAPQLARAIHGVAT